MGTFACLSASLSRLRGAGNRATGRTCTEWEELYRADLGLAELRLARLALLASGSGPGLYLPWERLKRDVAEVVAQHAGRFKAFLEALAVEPAGVPPLTLPGLILRTRVDLARAVRPTVLCLIFIDGMRLDTWEYLREVLVHGAGSDVAGAPAGAAAVGTAAVGTAAATSPLVQAAAGFTWAALPTVTEVQLAAVEAASFRGEILDLEGWGEPAAWDPAQVIAGLDCLGRPVEEARVGKFTFVDDKVHSSRDEYGTMVEELALQARRKLGPLLHALPPGGAALLFSDHGYAINYNYRKSQKQEMPRYLHGGASPAEVLAPWTLLVKAC